MLIRVELIDFRNYKRHLFELDKGVNLVVGLNAVGKTNLLEAIHLLALGEGFRAKKVDEMIRFGADFSKLEGEVEDADGEGVQLEVILTKGFLGDSRVAKRRYMVNGVPKRKKDYLGYLTTVIFRPEDLQLLVGSPDGRRSLVNKVFIQVDEEYQRSLTIYEQALRRRNKLLDAIREGAATRYALTFWDGLMIKHGQMIASKRQEWVDFINNLWSRSELFSGLKLVYDASPISEARLEQYRAEEEILGYTLVGPHKDDLFVEDAGRNLGVYGSRGEQRMAILGLKMGEIYFLEDKSDSRPLLLLDDIFSELDEKHSSEVLKVMKGRQVVVTTADEDDLKVFDGANVIRIE